MKQFKFPHIGMRTTKTAVAVMLSYLIFVPFGLLYNESYPGVLAYVGPTYSCIACIVCMQSSLEQTLQVGLSRFVGVFIGAILGVAMLLLEPLLSHWVGIVLMLGAACVCGIWLCMLFNRGQLYPGHAADILQGGDHLVVQIVRHVDARGGGSGDHHGSQGVGADLHDDGVAALVREGGHQVIDGALQIRVGVVHVRAVLIGQLEHGVVFRGVGVDGVQIGQGLTLVLHWLG